MEPRQRMVRWSVEMVESRAFLGPGHGVPAMVGSPCHHMVGKTRPGERTNILPWKDPPCYSWETPLFRLGHFQ